MFKDQHDLLFLFSIYAKVFKAFVLSSHLKILLEQITNIRSKRIFRQNKGRKEGKIK